MTSPRTSRRQVIAASGWAVPAVVVAQTAPAFAASPTACVPGDLTVEDLNTKGPFVGRSKADLEAKWEKYVASKAALTDASMVYSTEPNRTAPYERGVLTDEFRTALVSTANFYRWLTGVAQVTDGGPNPGLQAAALLQQMKFGAGYPFGHKIDSDGYTKPADMSQELWDEAVTARHNNIIRVPGPAYLPIRGWITEGNSNSGNPQLGHRLALLQPKISGLSFGHAYDTYYSRAIGLTDGTEATFTLPFTSYPAPGPNFAEDNPASLSAWTVFVDISQYVPDHPDWDKQAYITNPDGSTTPTLNNPAYGVLVVSIKNVRTGQVITRTVENGGLRSYGTFLGGLIAFDGPAATNEFFSDSYEVTITGLVGRGGCTPAIMTYRSDFYRHGASDATPVATGYPRLINFVYLYNPGHDDPTDNVPYEAARPFLPDSLPVNTDSGVKFAIVTDWPMTPNFIGATTRPVVEGNQDVQVPATLTYPKTIQVTGYAQDDLKLTATATSVSAGDAVTLSLGKTGQSMTYTWGRQLQDGTVEDLGVTDVPT